MGFTNEVTNQKCKRQNQIVKSGALVAIELKFGTEACINKLHIIKHSS